MDSETRSTDEAAEILGVSPNTIRRRIKSGELPSTLVAGYHRIPLESLTVASNQPTSPTDLSGDISDLPGLVDARTAAPILGMSVDAVWYHLRKNHIPSRKFGRRVLIPTAALATILDSGIA